MQKAWSPVTNEERELVFAVADGVPELIPILGHIRVITSTARDLNFLEILRWLKKEKIKGYELKYWMDHKHDGSILRAIAFIRMKVHSDFGIKKIFAKP